MCIVEGSSGSRGQAGGKSELPGEMWGQEKAEGWDRFQEECLHLGNCREAEGGEGEEPCQPGSGWTGLSSPEIEEPGGDS